MKTQVRMFALARQLAGAEAVEVELPETATVADLRRELSRRCPGLAGLMDRVLIAVDSEYAPDTQPVSGAREIACIPPVSGGADQ